MWDYLAQITNLLQANKNDLQREPPLFIAGDITHRWNEPAELINFALKHLPRCYAIPGNHDLPFHNPTNIEKSAYWTLVAAGKIEHFSGRRISLGKSYLGEVCVDAFEFGREPMPLTDGIKGSVYIALVHHYVWEEGHAFPGCPQEDHVSVMRDRLKGYHAAFFGDNHKPFYSGYKALTTGKDMPIVNCGCMIRRSIDDMEYDPSVWLLRRSGRIERHLLNAPDKMVRAKDTSDVEKIDITEFMQLVAGLDHNGSDFKNYLHRLIRNTGQRITKRCQNLILQILNEL